MPSEQSSDEKLQLQGEVWKCPDHGLVEHGSRAHGGRSAAFECGKDGCMHTVSHTLVDWNAYETAVDADAAPPCPRCGTENVDEVPVSRNPFRCNECGHDYGYAGAYY